VYWLSSRTVRLEMAADFDPLGGECVLSVPDIRPPNTRLPPGLGPHEK